MIPNVPRKAESTVRRRPAQGASVTNLFAQQYENEIAFDK